MNFFGILKEKPIPYKTYSLNKAMEFMKEYGEMYDFPSEGNGFKAVPKRNYKGGKYESKRRMVKRI